MTDAAPRDSRVTLPPNRTDSGVRERPRPRGAVAARACRAAPRRRALAALLAAIEEAKALASRRDAARDDALASVDASALAARLEEAERENDELRERVAELTALNDDAAAELLQDAAELAAALANAEDLEEEAEALRVLNARLADAAKEVAAMVVDDDASSSSAETHLEKLRAEADSARAALATAEHRAKAERDALLSRVRALEVDLAEAEAEPVGGEAEDRDALASAREKIEGLSALAARRGDALLQAEAAAASAAAEVASLKKQLETAAAAAAAAAASATAAIRALETDMASMLTEEESAARVRELELAMAEMVDAEEMDALLVHVRAVEARAADMVDAEALAAAEARAEALSAEAEALRARVRALETEMASMSYDDEADEADEASGVRAWKAKVRSLETEMASMSYDDEAAASAKAARGAQSAPAPKARALGARDAVRARPEGDVLEARVAVRGEEAARSAPVGNARANAVARRFERAAPESFALRRKTFPASTRASAAASSRVERPAGATRLALDAVTFAFGGTDEEDATTTKKTPSKPFERSPPEAFILRKFDFPAVRAKVTSVERGRAKPFSRADGGAFVKRRLTFFDADASRPTLAVEGSASMPVGAFVRTPGVFKLRRFDFVKAEGVRGGGDANDAPRRAFRRGGGFSLRRFKFHP